MAELLVIGTDPALEDECRDAASGLDGRPPEVRLVPDLAQGLEVARIRQPTLVCATLEEGPEALVRFADALVGVAPEAAVVALRGGAAGPDLGMRLLRSRVRDLLERIDNRSTVADVIERLAQDTGQGVSEIADRCRRAFQVMLERGLVTLDPATERPPTPVEDPEESTAPTASKVIPSSAGTDDDVDDISPTQRIAAGSSSSRHEDDDPPPPNFGQSTDGMDSLDPDAPHGPGHTIKGR